jgi:hypothetical protein
VEKTPIPSMAERTIPLPLEATHGDNESKKRKRIWLAGKLGIRKQSDPKSKIQTNEQRMDLHD